MSDQTKGYIIALIGITFWSTTAIFMGYLITNYGLLPLVLAFWRNVFVCVALIPVLFLVNQSLLKISKDRLMFFILYGLILAFFNSIWTLSLETNGAAVSTVLIYSSAGFGAVLARWLFKETLGYPKIIAIALSLTGCVMVSNAYSLDMWQLNLLGVSTGLLSGVLFAIYSLMGKEAARRKINPWTSMLYSFAFGSVFIMIFNMFSSLPGSAGSLSALIPDLPLQGWLILMLLSFVPTIMGYGLYNTSMNYLPVSIANLLATLEPGMTAVQAYIFLSERMTITQIIGGIVILSAVVIVQFEKEPSKKHLEYASH
jgi:drug/metabolite transporter (DMT)-like permease